MLLPQTIHPTWQPFLTDEVIELIQKIESQIGEDFNPSPAEKALRFLSLDLTQVKIIIQGMDAYPSMDPTVATGRSFEVGNLTSWEQPFRQVSLKNILRLLYKNYHGIEAYSDIKKFSELQQEIKEGTFKILPPNELFDAWEQQGVLCLNIYPTCQRGKPGSHKAIWQPFSVKLITFLSTHYPHLKWFLWGAESQSSRPYIQQGQLYECRHPMMCSEKYADDFLKSTCFQDTMEEVNWLGC